MSDNKIWFSTNVTKESVVKALNILLALEFTGAILSLKFVNFFRICKDLEIEIKDKNDRSQEAAKDACADLLVKGKVGFTTEIMETFQDFKVKVFDNGSMVVTGTHASYPGGFFEWSPFHCFVEVVTGEETKGFVKVGMVQADGKKINFKSTTANKNRKIFPHLPGSDKNPNRYVKVESDGFIFWIDTSWSKGKVFLDRKAYQSLLKKGTTSSASTNPFTATATGITAEPNDED